MRTGQLNHPDHQHPYNLPTWRKLLMLATVSLTAFAANEMAAAHLTAFPEVAENFKVTIAATANTIGIGILGLGTGPPAVERHLRVRGATSRLPPRLDALHSVHSLALEGRQLQQLCCCPLLCRFHRLRLADRACLAHLRDFHA